MPDILVLTEAVPSAPGDIVLREQHTKVSGINKYREPVTHYSADPLLIRIRDSKPAAFIIHEAVKGDLSFRTEVVVQFMCHGQDGCLLHTKLRVGIIRDAVDCPMIPAVLFLAPCKCFEIQFSYVCAGPGSQKVFFYKADQAFDSTLVM